MQILAKRIEKGIGFVRLVPTDDEDLWHIYNLIGKGDVVQAVTIRQVIIETDTGMKQVFLKRMQLRLHIQNVGYFSNEDRLVLQLQGKNMTENQFVKLNQYHRIDVEINRPLTIVKDDWDIIHLSKLKELSNPTHDTDIVALVMEEGVGHLCYVKTSMTFIKQKITKNIPNKRSGNQIHTQHLQAFFEECMKALFTVDFQNIKCCIIASPGFVKDQFLDHVKKEIQNEIYQKQRKQGILEKILLLSCSSGYQNSLTEILGDKAVQERLKDTKAIKQVTVLNDFYQTLTQNSDQVAYGVKHVKIATDQNAIGTLLISDKLFQSKDLEKRKQFIQLINQVQKNGGKVHIFSSMHSSGEQLDSLTGIAAILRYPLEIDDEMDDDLVPATEEQQRQTDQAQQAEEISKGPMKKINQDILDWINQSCVDSEDGADEEILLEGVDDPPTQLKKSDSQKEGKNQQQKDDHQPPVKLKKSQSQKDGKQEQKQQQHDDQQDLKSSSSNEQPSNKKKKN